MLNVKFALVRFILYCLIKICAASPCTLNTAIPGCDIADNATKFPDPCAWYTNPAYPGVTLVGPNRCKKCNWKANKNFVWTTQENQCILNGGGYPMNKGSYPACSMDRYIKDKASYDETTKKWINYAFTSAVPTKVSYTTAYIVTVNGHKAAMSIGHGALNGLCGSCFLVQQGDKYAVQLQVDVRAWSFEMTTGAALWLAADNEGGTCYIPEVTDIPCSSVFSSFENITTF